MIDKHAFYLYNELSYYLLHLILYQVCPTRLWTVLHSAPYQPLLAEVTTAQQFHLLMQQCLSFCNGSLTAEDGSAIEN